MGTELAAAARPRESELRDILARIDQSTLESFDGASVPFFDAIACLSAGPLTAVQPDGADRYLPFLDRLEELVEQALSEFEHLRQFKAPEIDFDGCPDLTVSEDCGLLPAEVHSRAADLFRRINSSSRFLLTDLPDVRQMQSVGIWGTWPLSDAHHSSLVALACCCRALCELAKIVEAWRAVFMKVWPTVPFDAPASADWRLRMKVLRASEEFRNSEDALFRQAREWADCGERWIEQQDLLALLAEKKASEVAHARIAEAAKESAKRSASARKAGSTPKPREVSVTAAVLKAVLDETGESGISKKVMEALKSKFREGARLPSKSTVRRLFKSMSTASAFKSPI